MATVVLARVVRSRSAYARSGDLAQVEPTERREDVQAEQVPVQALGPNGHLSFLDQLLGVDAR